MHKIFALVAMLLLAGCSTTETIHTDSQCIGAMTTQEAYGHLNPNHFTVQVLALKEERQADVKQYINGIQGQEPIWVNWKRSQGYNWYAVIYGDFETKDEAKMMIEQLPAAVRQQGPFIRSFADVQADKQTDVFRLR
ncbi:SPOR domain-containing protein [Photobacterium aphoticum]|uniref:Cell division protein DamX n=1 Tax=Photobacterium aphoticum TaxID=754436 RepID=A0A0J1GRH7_9GAMM|nr:SPOR domain-containing protein [Photobacterium aphoticum]KLV02029.1 cell division protein DamX [Photobacterium aphoticum]PSU60274.1 cell division protein DamX [Photobacterium aphoticum]GHA34541.1 cell division protein DamX [Photobacterium aphoticum]